jgi:hypothetical protein
MGARRIDTYEVFCDQCFDNTVRFDSYSERGAMEKAVKRAGWERYTKHTGEYEYPSSAIRCPECAKKEMKNVATNQTKT